MATTTSAPKASLRKSFKTGVEALTQITNRLVGRREKAQIALTTMVVETIDNAALDDVHSVSTESQVTEDPALKDSQSGKSTSGTSAASSEESSKFVKKETLRVLYLRIGVVLLLACASAAISMVVYFITASAEEENFESQYYAAAEKVTESFLDIATKKMPAVGSLIVAMVAHGQDHENSWPYVTLSSFQERATTVKDLSGVLYLGYNPLVAHANRLAWENYTINHPDAQWYQEGREYQKTLAIDDLDNRPQVKTDDPNFILTNGVSNYIYDFRRDEGGKGVISPEADWYLPIWMTSPVTQRSMVNQNRASNSQGSIDCMKYQEVVFEGMQYAPAGFGSDENPNTAEIAWLLRLANRERTRYDGDIFTTIFFPVYDKFDPATRETVAVMRAVIHWARYFNDNLPKNIKGLVTVLENGCDEPYTYQIEGANVVPLGHGDFHDSKYDKYMRTATFADIESIGDGTEEGMKLHFDKCPYNIRVYPSDHMKDIFTTSTPAVVTSSVAIVFLFTLVSANKDKAVSVNKACESHLFIWNLQLVFFAFDRMVERRQHILMDKAKRTHRIVASLFPKNIRDQILNDDGELRQGGLLGTKNTLNSIARGGIDEHAAFGQMPIADLYPEATVLVRCAKFADISGFTSWSSSREPAQVFVLLQQLYQEFDSIAKRRKVFKVDTIGDSYVACAGVPEPEPAHAIKIVRFAWECMIKMREVTRELETQLGPGTGELNMRFGINSGPVTAGLLRGDRSRFQLFGDTVNTAARMESARSGMRSGKEHWLEARNDLMSAKGKGILRTFFITPFVDKTYSADSRTPYSEEEDEDVLNADFAGKLADELLRRQWVSELIRDSVREIVAHREIKKGKGTKFAEPNPSHRSRNRTPLDEVVDVIEMPAYNSKAANAQSEAFAIKIPERGHQKSTDTIATHFSFQIAAAYKKNPFHNFDHACHVTMCVSKFLKRIVSPDLSDDELAKMKDNKKLASRLHVYTHGINSDPVTLFAILFSAIIHDVVSASLDWTLEPKSCMYIFLTVSTTPYRIIRVYRTSNSRLKTQGLGSDTETKVSLNKTRWMWHGTSSWTATFVVVNVVLATDIFDPELNDLRKKRWNQAFSECGPSTETNNARATVVIEHIMQASDVCHTMQHWHVYKRFNQKLFEELMVAYRQGRCAANPTDFWYEGELKFFDNYNIFKPLMNRGLPIRNKTASASSRKKKKSKKNASERVGRLERSRFSHAT
eukprot:scaffold6242_cov168-Amphora_coffeaeformis.AAC.1